MRESTRLNPYYLTQREMEVLSYLCQPLLIGEIAELLCLSEATVQRHQSAIAEKLGLEENRRGRPFIIIQALREHIVPLNPRGINE